MRMRICFLSSSRYSRPLGLTNEKKFQALKSLGELYIIGFSRNLFPRWFTEYARFYLFPELPIGILRYIEMFIIAPFLVLWVILRHGVRVFVAQSPFEGVVAALAKGIASWFGHRIVVVVESHGDFEESVFMQRRIYFTSFYRFLMNRAACFTLRHADLLRAVSDSTRQQLERWKPGHHIFQFVTWTDVETFQKAGKERQEDFSQTFLYAGLLIPRKGVVHLVKAFASIAPDFSQARLLIIGREENQTYAARLTALVKDLGLEHRIQFLGEVSQQELAQYMGQACAFVFPTYSEGLPRVVFEAMSTGLPVIATAVSGIPEIVREGSTGFLLQPGDESSLVEKMRWILEHPEASQQMGRKAHAFACTSFSTKAYIQGYQQIFQTAQTLLNQE